MGLPIKIWPSMQGLILARLISAVMGAALLAAALVSIVRYSRHRLMFGALLFAASPMAINMSGAINPNGVGTWQPILGSAVPLLAVAAGVALVGCLAWLGPPRAARRPDEPSAAAGTARTVSAVPAHGMAVDRSR